MPNSAAEPLDGPEHVAGYVLAQTDSDGHATLLQSRPRKNPEHLRRTLDGYGGRTDIDIYEVRRVRLPRKAGGR